MKAAHSTLFGFSVIALGAVLAFVSAVVPHYSHHKLLPGVLLVGILPYVGYGLVVVFMKNLWSVAAGAALLSAHAALVAVERFGDSVDYSDGFIYSVPAALAIAILPAAILALRRPWHK